MSLHERTPSKSSRLAITILWAGILVSLAGSARAAEIRAVHRNGDPAWIERGLGQIAIPRPSSQQSAEDYHADLTRALTAGTQQILARHLYATGHEEIQLERVTEDAAGRTHLSFTQRVSGLEVVGAGFRVHLDSESADPAPTARLRARRAGGWLSPRAAARARAEREEADVGGGSTASESSTGQTVRAGNNLRTLRRTVAGFNGRFYRHGRDYDSSRLNPMDFDRALAMALNELRASARAVGDHELVMLGGGDELELAYRVTVAFVAGGAPEILYVGATDGRFLGSEPTMIPGLPPEPDASDQPSSDSPYNSYMQRFIARTMLASTFSMFNDEPTDWFPRCDQTVGLPLPGFVTTPVCSTSDQAAKRAQSNQMKVYRYYASKQSRSSYDAAHGDLDSIVDAWDPKAGFPNNAFWNRNEKRMYYGQGDQSNFLNFTLGFDVAAHELTHGITNETSKLFYRKQSGALSESMSDVFAAVIEAWDDGGINGDTWRIGEDVVGPSFGKSALRYMNNPGLDDHSPDHFSKLVFPDPCTPAGGPNGNDWCGVHSNSGIPNLAFYLLVEGGVHPTGESNILVNGIGMEKAAKIFYVTNRDLLTSSSNFLAARLATESAAASLYDAATAQSVSDAWAAVGVTP